MSLEKLPSFGNNKLRAKNLKKRLRLRKLQRLLKLFTKKHPLSVEVQIILERRINIYAKGGNLDTFERLERILKECISSDFGL